MSTNTASQKASFCGESSPLRVVAEWCRIDTMTFERLNIQMTPALLKLLRSESKRTGESVASIIRRIVSDAFYPKRER